LQWGPEPGGEQVHGILLKDSCGVGTPLQASPEQPSDEFGLVADHALEGEDGEAKTDLLHVGTEQSIAQLRVTRQYDRQHAAAVDHHFAQPLQSIQRLVVKVVGSSTNNTTGRLLLRTSSLNAHSRCSLWAGILGSFSGARS